MKWFKTFEEFKKSQDLVEEYIDNKSIEDNIKDNLSNSNIDKNDIVYIDNWEKY